MLLTASAWTAVSSSNATAQIPRNVQEIFETFVEELDSELARPFRDALAEDRAAVRFSPQVFRKFRDHPLNPFEELYNIQPRDDEGEITINFELPSLRNRKIGVRERQADDVVETVSPAATVAARSVVEIYKGKRQIALGTIVTADGLIVTKASEVQKRMPVTCRIDGEMKSATMERVDTPNDVALLKIEAKGLTPVEWSHRNPDLGDFLVTPGQSKLVLAVGTYAVTPRTTVLGDQAFLGVNPDEVAGGVKVSEIQPGEAAYEAGLRDGDVLTHFENQPLVTVADLVNAVRVQKPGDRVKIQYRRAGRPATALATLAGRNMSGERAARFLVMNRLGAILSKRSDNFPWVFQHDSPLFPEQCGGPIVDLEGKVVGLNIARDGRASCLAIPSTRMQTIVNDLRRKNVAAMR